MDTGACCFIQKEFADEINMKINPLKEKYFILANKTQIKPIGQSQVTLSLSLNGQTKSAELQLFVMEDLSWKVIIGYNLIRKFGIKIDGENNTITY